MGDLDTSIGALPAPQEGRILILCFDGTTDLFDTNTNAVKLMSFLKTDDYSRQMVYYQSGVGTYISPNFMMPLNVKLAKLLDSAFAWDLNEHVMGGYRFLMENWLPADRIMLFGFSRGAYTARALAGMLQKVGLLPRGNDEQVPYAYKMYKRIDAQGWVQSDAFKKTMSNPVCVDFVGVWETVAAAACLMNDYLPFAASNYHIRVFRHALALDERRCRFHPNLWHYTVPPFEAPPPADVENGTNSGALKQKTDVEEVWFVGGHGDVGGGFEPDKNAGGLTSRIPLIWIVRESILTGTGILWDADALEQAGFKLPTVDAGGATTDNAHGAGTGSGSRLPLADGASESSIPLHNRLSALDSQYDADAAATTHDELVLQKLWWLLEVLPFKYRRQESNGSWKTYFRAGLGRPRHIPNPPPPANVHVSVQQRMSSVKGYAPKAKLPAGFKWVE